MKWLPLALVASAAAAALLYSRQAAASNAPSDTSSEDLPATLPEPTVLESFGIADMTNTRGERNNNPGNIRKGSASWLGATAGTDSAFVTFSAPKYGIRALARTLKNYQANYGLNTVRGIIARWAPPSENDTAAYQKAVAAEMGVTVDTPLDLNDPVTLTDLTTAIIHHENGRVIYAQADIEEGVALA